MSSHDYYITSANELQSSSYQVIKDTVTYKMVVMHFLRVTPEANALFSRM
jgi:hypothetical protein